MGAEIDHLQTDILILGSGGAGLFAALHAHNANPNLDITVAVKGLLGKCGCTRMVQGGYNVALAPGDSVERHFMDTINGGKWLPDQDLAWTLVESAGERVRELENEIGCFFDRNADGSVHQKAFAGQTFDRTVHKGDLTGIEIIGRLAEQVWAAGIHRLEEHRALALIPAADGDRLSGVLMTDVRTGKLVFVQARATLLATGGGPTMYRYHTPSGDKSCDGMAMALRAGLPLRDMEMVQFHPTGLLAGNDTRMTGTVLEEGLRGAGGHLLNGEGQRFMLQHDDRGERATRDIVSRGIFHEIREGRGTPKGGVYISMSHLGPDNVRQQFKGMVERCADSGFDLAGGRVEVVPTAHYMMGGVAFKPDCTTEMTGLFAAGEDTGGVHGANRLGGNGVANSTVFGGIAGDSMAAWLAEGHQSHAPDTQTLQAAARDALRPLENEPGSLLDIQQALHALMWDKAGILRTKKRLESAATELEALDEQLSRTGLQDTGSLAFNLTWHDWLNLRNQILVSRTIVQAALSRKNSRGAHYREDYPGTGEMETSYYTVTELDATEGIKVHNRDVQFTRVAPDESLLEDETAVAPQASAR